LLDVTFVTLSWCSSWYVIIMELPLSAFDTTVLLFVSFSLISVTFFSLFSCVLCYVYVDLLVVYTIVLCYVQSGTVCSLVQI
jgi:hypothetical protein